ncbi:MAG TPA: nitroreductase family deazaflavin-dependent oxidoreductase [Dermatophilaceae bacterium]|nr:nitroreductase family deazaflavin-dependent oxidoreductase [Dermatophilaceae bacterium]
MPLPKAITTLNRDVLNPLMVRLAGLGPFVELEHVGRRSGRVLHTVLMAFRHEQTVTVALTYGSDVDWLKNLRAAGGGRMRHRRQVLTLGPPADLGTAEGLRRMPPGPRQLLPVLGCRQFVEFEVLDEAPLTKDWSG